MIKHIKTIHRHLQHPYIQGLIFLLVLMASFYFFTPRKKASPGFDSIEVLTHFVSGCPELPPMDNNNVLKPDYTKFYLSRQEHYWGRRLAIIEEWLGLKKRTWSVELFVDHLQKLVKEREAQNRSDNFITKITPVDGGQIYVFGDLQGAFHSMTRCLNHMIDLGLLDKKLKIIDQKSFIILMGDAISRSPYNIETLSLINELMLKNPDRFIYIKGNHESNNYWQGFGLKTELILRAADLSKEQVPFGDLVNKFFNTLPHAVYIDMGNQHFIKISPKEIEGKAEEFEKTYGKLLLEKNTQEIMHCLRKDAGEDGASEVIIKAIIRAEEKKKDFQSMDGMRLVGSEGDAVVWALLSCPTLAYQQGLKFFSDAFAVIKSSKLLEEWTITVHTRDSREPQKPFVTRSNNLLSGKEGAEKARTENKTENKIVAPVQEKLVEKQVEVVKKEEPAEPAKQAGAVKPTEKKEELIKKTEASLLKDLSHTVPATSDAVAPSVTDQTVTFTKKELKEIVVEAVKEALVKKLVEKREEPEATAQPSVKVESEIEPFSEKFSEDEAKEEAEEKNASKKYEEDDDYDDEIGEFNSSEESEWQKGPDYTDALNINPTIDF